MVGPRATVACRQCSGKKAPREQARRRGRRGAPRAGGQKVSAPCVLNTAPTGLFHQSGVVHKKAPRGRDRRDYTLNSTTLGPTNGASFTLPPSCPAVAHSRRHPPNRGGETSPPDLSSRPRTSSQGTPTPCRHRTSHRLARNTSAHRRDGRLLPRSTTTVEVRCARRVSEAPACHLGRARRQPARALSLTHHQSAQTDAGGGPRRGFLQCP